MHKSKLEIYEEALSALVDKNLSVGSLASECKLNRRATKRIIAFLEKNLLVEKNPDDTETLYSLTSRGEAVYKRLKGTKRLKKLKESIKTKVIYAPKPC